MVEDYKFEMLLKDFERALDNGGGYPEAIKLYSLMKNDLSQETVQAIELLIAEINLEKMRLWKDIQSQHGSGTIKFWSKTHRNRAYHLNMVIIHRNQAYKIKHLIFPLEVKP